MNREDRYDYDVPYPCACCGKYTTFYLCSRCAKEQYSRPEEAASKETELSRIAAIVSRAGDVEEISKVINEAIGSGVRLSVAVSRYILEGK